jgi:hypothetical protein
VRREWSLEFSDDHGIRGSFRLGLGDDAPAPATFTARLTLPDEGVVVVHDDDVTPPRGEQLVIRGEGLWAELLCETPGEHWSFGLEAFGVRFADEAEAAASDRGDRVAVGFDLVWETPDHVYGELLLGRRQLDFDGTGTFRSPPSPPSRSGVDAGE